MQQRKAPSQGEPAVTRASFVAPCSSRQAFAILSSPTHRKHLDEDYLGSALIRYYSAIGADAQEGLGRARSASLLPVPPASPTKRERSFTALTGLPPPSPLRSPLVDAFAGSSTASLNMPPPPSPDTPVQQTAGSGSELSVQIRQYAFASGKECVDAVVLDAISRPPRRATDEPKAWVLGQRSLQVRIKALN
mgnify:CR=1 FL=1